MQMNYPQISVVIPTIGRESLMRATESALEQDVASEGIEVIVANDSGRPLREETVPRDPRVTIIATNRRRQSIARNTGAAVARGQYLLFLDDDDYLVPGALARLLGIMAAQPKLVVAYGGVAFVDEGEHELGTLNLGVSGNCASQMLAAALILLGSALIRADAFFAVGAVNPLFTISEEIDLFRRLAMIGDFGNTTATTLMVVRGAGWSSSQNYGPAVDLLRTSREGILDQQEAFTRLAQSARTSYWFGRNAKSYAASAYWNMRKGRLLKAQSRLLFFLLALATALPGVLSRDFWRAVADSQVPATFQRALEASGRGG